MTKRWEDEGLVFICWWNWDEQLRLFCNYWGKSERKSGKHPFKASLYPSMNITFPKGTTKAKQKMLGRRLMPCIPWLGPVWTWHIFWEVFQQLKVSCLCQFTALVLTYIAINGSSLSYIKDQILVTAGEITNLKHKDFFVWERRGWRKKGSLWNGLALDIIHRKAVLPFSETWTGWRVVGGGTWWNSTKASARSCT